MKSGEENNKKATRLMKSLMGKLNEDNPQFKPIINGENHNIINDQKQKEINKEIIRRLRIQNKKLIEQVIKLKEEIKKTKFNKNQVSNHINDLLKLINR